VGLFLLTSGSIFAGVEVDDFEPVHIKVHPQSKPFKLPDGSEVTQNQSNFFVKEPGASCYATTWKDYVLRKNLNLQVIVDSSENDQTPVLRIIRGTAPFKLPDGSEVSHNGGDEVWVKTLGQAYYVTPWSQYITQTSIQLVPRLVSRPKALVEMTITRASPLFTFKLPDGCEVHVNNGNRVWVKTPQQSFPNTRWEDYIYSRKLNIWPVVTNGDVDAVKLHIKRGSIPFSFPGGYKIATNSSDEVWVQEPGCDYFATPWAIFTKKVGLMASPVIVNEQPCSIPVRFDEPQEALLKEGYKGVFKINQQACQFGYSTFSGKEVTPESLRVASLAGGSKKYAHFELTPPSPSNFKTVYRVIQQDSFEAAREMINQGLSPCVSNAANKDTPGGGVVAGAQAQEEEICKRSTLYRGLLPSLYPMKDNELIYNPDVTVFMHPQTYSFMENPYQLAVITQAYLCLPGNLSNYSEPEKSVEYQKITIDKVRAHLRLAAQKGHDSVVLTASGCGAFSGGRPGLVSQAVAKIYHEILKNEFKGVFKEVRFAILSTLVSSIFRNEFNLSK